MKVKKIRIGGLKKEEWFAMVTTLKELVEAYGPDILYILPYYPSFLTMYEWSDELLEKLKKSSYTKPLSDAGKNCRKVFLGFFQTVRAASNQEAVLPPTVASHLFERVNSYYPFIMKGSKGQMEGGYHNLMQDLNGDYVTDVTALGLSRWITTLESAKSTYLGLLHKRNEEKSKRPKGELAKARQEVNMYYHFMENTWNGYLTLHGFIDDVPEVNENTGGGNGGNDGGGTGDGGNSGGGGIGDGDFERTIQPVDPVYKFVTEWNVVLGTYGAIAAQRASRRKNKKQKEDEGESAPGE